MKTINIWLQRIIRSKTMIFSLLLAIFGVLQASQNVFSSFLTPKSFGLVTVAIGVIVAALRVVTVKSLGDK